MILPTDYLLAATIIVRYLVSSMPSLRPLNPFPPFQLPAIIAFIGGVSSQIVDNLTGLPSPFHVDFG
jgi:hypothetical protein